MIDVIVILDPAFGDRLESLLQFAPVWIVDTKTNNSICERIWRDHKQSDHRKAGAITCFSVSENSDPVKGLLSILPNIETHHGRPSGNELLFPDGFVLRIIRVPLNSHVIEALRRYVFTSFNESADGFDARKCK